MRARAGAHQLVLLLFLGAAPELLGDASPAFAVPPHGAGGIAVPPSPRGLRAPRFVHYELRARRLAQLSGSSGDSSSIDGLGGGTDGTQTAPMASMEAARGSTIPGKGLGGVGVQEHEEAEGEEELTPAALKELRVGILVDWLRIMALTISAHHASADASAPAGPQTCPPSQELHRPDECGVVESLVDYLCSGGEVGRADMQGDAARRGASITFPKFEAAVKRMKLVDAYWDDEPEAHARDGAIEQMFDLLAQGQHDISRHRMKEVLHALNISASAQGMASRALYGTRHAAAPTANRVEGSAAREGGQAEGADSGAGASGAVQVGGDGPMQWRYLRYNQWHRYDANASQHLEAALAAGHSSASLFLRTNSASAVASDGACEYVVRFCDSADSAATHTTANGSFWQFNTRTGHVRAVRRAPAASFRRALVPELLTAPRLEPLVEAALRTAEPLRLCGGTFVLRDEIALSATRARLQIRGPGKIIGDSHTLFKVSGNKAQLEAEDVEFVHVASATRQERRELGAAVLVLGKATATFENCSLKSEQGFGLWLSQKSRVRAQRCLVTQCGRSAVVMFGHGALVLVASNITSPGMNGICARGNTRVTATGCRVEDAPMRGIYAYENATLELAACAVSGTRNAGLAALQVESLQASDSATLVMDSTCTFDLNRGLDIHVAGTVRCSGHVASVYGVRPVSEALGARCPEPKSWAGEDLAAV